MTAHWKEGLWTMAEKVQLNLEHQLAELRDLQEKKIFAEVSSLPLATPCSS